MKYDVSCRYFFFKDICYQTEEIPLFSWFSECIYQEWMLSIVICIYLHDCTAFLYILIDFSNVKLVLHYWDKVPCVMIFLIILLLISSFLYGYILFAHILLQGLCLCS